MGLLLCVSGCEDDEQGAASFTTWGEAYIEDEIPSDPSGEAGYVDGWTVRYDKFLAVFHAIRVADQNGKVAATMKGSMLVDNTIAGVEPLLSFPGLDAKHWDDVSYQIRPAKADTEIVAGDQADLDLMVENGYSLYVAGSASKTDDDGKLVTKTFHWGFSAATQYSGCQQAEESGQALQGIVVSTAVTTSRS